MLFSFSVGEPAWARPWWESCLCSVALRLDIPLGFLECFLWISPGHFLVPGGMVRPCPGFADCAARHRLHRSRLADCAQIDVNEYSSQHDQGGNVVNYIAQGHRPAAEDFGEPHNDAGDDVSDAAAHNLPELRFLAGVEEACVRRFDAVA